MPLKRIGLFRTTTALSANGLFTSDSKRCTDFKTIRGIVYSDKASASNGFKIQQSVDGTHWDITDYDSVAAATVFTFEYTLYGEFVRLLYKNGDTAQTSFRMTAYMVS